MFYFVLAIFILVCLMTAFSIGAVIMIPYVEKLDRKVEDTTKKVLNKLY